MTIRLLRQNRIDGQAGDIVEVTPARADYLIRYGLAEPVCEREKKQTPEDAIQQETPEDAEPKETPEAVKPQEKRKTTTARKGKQSK